MVLCYPAVFFELDLVQIRSGGTDSYCVWQLRAARLLLVVLVVIFILSNINIILSYIFCFKYARA